MKSKLDELFDLIDEQELDNTEIVYDRQPAENKGGVSMKYYSFTPAVPAQPMKKFTKDQIKTLELKMKAQGKL